MLESIKKLLSGLSPSDDAYYEVVAQELAHHQVLPGLWARALANAQGDETRARGAYIKLRVEALKTEAMNAKAALAQHQKDLVSDAIPAYQRKDFVKALQGFTIAAASGHSWAQNYLGIMHHYGLGVSKDLHEAIRWYKASAQKNDAYGQYNMGLLCLRDLSQYSDAISWFELAEKNGYPDAKEKKKEAVNYLKAHNRLRRL